MATEKINRCNWGNANETLIKYHDTEWGTPVHDDTKHFEFLVLDGFQAGLSWSTILNKRNNFRKAFDNFNFRKIAKYDDSKVEELLQDEGIIRNKLKIKAAINNAKCFISVIEEFGSFDKFIWGFTENRTIENHWQSIKDIPASSKESDAMSKALKNRGFTFVGTTICYAYMQAAGMVNDHTIDCFRHRELTNSQHDGGFRRSSKTNR
jgi:DNA-3-methyladenine glycosylase I